MSSDFGDDFFTAPLFKADEALAGLKRLLRDQKSLAERAGGFEIGGRRVVEFNAEAAVITARLAKRPSASPEWETLTLKNSADVRKCLDEIRRRVSRWQDNE